MNDLSSLYNIPVTLSVRLGKTTISIKKLTELQPGSIVELDGLAGEPLDILINDVLVAQGEVVIVNEKFGIRITDIITTEERIRRLHK